MPVIAQLICAFVFAFTKSRFSDDLACFPSWKDFRLDTNEPRHEKTNVEVSNMVQHKPECTATKDG